MMKKVSTKLLVGLMAAIFVLTSCAPTIESGFAEVPQAVQPTDAIYFVDDMGNTINLDQACEQMVVLYSAHTENLYSLGVGDKVIGVN